MVRHVFKSTLNIHIASHPHRYSTVEENIFGAPKMRYNYGAISLFFFQYWSFLYSSL